MALTKQDLTAIRDVVVDAVGEVIEQNVNPQFEEIRADLTKIQNQLQSVENYKVTQLQLIRMLHRKKLLTAEEVRELGLSSEPAKQAA